MGRQVGEKGFFGGEGTMTAHQEGFLCLPPSLLPGGSTLRPPRPPRASELGRRPGGRGSLSCRPFTSSEG